MKLYTVVVYNLRICLKKDNHSPKNIKGDNSRLFVRDRSILCDLTHSSRLYYYMNCCVNGCMLIASLVWIQF